MQQRPDVQLQRRHEEYRKLSDQVVRLSDNADEQDAHQIGQEGASRFETDFLSDPAKNAPCQVLLGRNGVGKTTILNALFMLAEDDENVSASREKAPRRQIERGNMSIPVSEAVAEVFDEDEVLRTTGQIQYVCNPNPDSAHDTQEHEDDRLTKGPIRNHIKVGAPEAHVEQRSFLLNTGCQTGTTTNSTLRAQYGHIAGAVERFKSRQQLQSDAYEYVQLIDADRQHEQKVYERYKLITGLTKDDPLPDNVREVTLCPHVEDVSGKIRVYSGHAESLLSFRWFLRDSLIANQPMSPDSVHVALDSTTIYWPSSSLLVPIIDTPGTGDANVLNEATTEAAIDDAIHQSSQLVVCGTKTLSAEKTVESTVIRYMQFMITSKEVTPCIRVVLLPETNGRRYTHKSVCSQSVQQERQEQIASSEEQLHKWMLQANEQLPEQLRAQPAGRLSALLERCEVKVAYMNLYACLCLQSHDDLRQLAHEAGSDERFVAVEELLEATGGPWLLGLSSQLGAQAVLPALEEMHDVLVEQLVSTLHSRQTSSEHGLLPEHKLSLAEGVYRLQRNEQLLQLRKDTMLPKITSKMAALKTEICHVFASLGQACQRDCEEQSGHIEGQWKKRISGTSRANLSNSLVRVQSVSKTAAYRTTFKHTGVLARMDDVLGAVEEKAASSLTTFARQHVLAEIVTNIVDCLKPSLPESAHTALQSLVQTVAGDCVMPHLDALVKRFVKRLLHPANLRASQQGVQARCAGTHLLKGHLRGTTEAAWRHELMRRVAETLRAAQIEMPTVFDGHVHEQAQGFVAFLTRNGKRYRGGVERFTRTLVKQLAAYCRGVPQGAEAVRARFLYNEAVGLKQAIQHDINALKEQAATPLMLGSGLAASLHRAAMLTAQLQQHPDLLFLLDRRVCNPASQLPEHAEHGLDVETNWAELAEVKLQGTFTMESQQQLLWHKSLGLPPWSDDEWQHVANNSLPAALQYHIWPADMNISLRSQMSQQWRIWKGIRILIAHTLIGVWDKAHVQSWLQKELRHGAGNSAKLEPYMQRVLDSNGQMGLLELLAFVMSGLGDSETQNLCVQLWLPNRSEPLVLSNLSSTASTENGGRSRRTFACNLLPVTLPKSKQVVWLPLRHARHTHITGRWEQRFSDLDVQLFSTKLEASAAGSSTVAAAQPVPVGLRALAQAKRPGGTNGHSRTKRARGG